MATVENQWITTIEQPVAIEVGEGVYLRGNQIVPEDYFGLILFAHAREMSRSSSGSRRTVRELEEQGLAVLTFDLLSPDEQEEELRTGRRRLDIALAASRYLGVAAWASDQSELGKLPTGLLGVGAGAAAALVAAAERPAMLGAVVCQGGRADLAGSALAQVAAPTLLIVGANDALMLRGNESALVGLGSARKELVIVPDGSSRFGDREEMERVAGLTAEWFSQNLILLN